MLDPRNPASIPFFINLSMKPVVVLCNGPQIDRLQATFWDRLNAIQRQADSEVLVVGINRIGIAEACLKHRYKPDVLATVDRPVFRAKTPRDLAQECAARAARYAEEDRAMAILKRTNPKAYEHWEATRDRLRELETKEELQKKGLKAEYVPTPVTDAFMRSFHSCAGVSIRVVSQQAIDYLVPQRVPGKDIILNLDTSIVGPPDRAKMLFTTADWVTNWFARIGCREFYYYGMSMREGAHCKCLGLVEDDDYSWTEPKRRDICYKSWDALRDAFPGLRLYNCDRKSLFVEKGVMEFKTPPQIDPTYKLMSDEECLARARAVIDASKAEVARRVDEALVMQRQDMCAAKA